MSKQTITLTAGEVAENHIGMEKIGEIADHGYNVKELAELCSKLQKDNIDCELIDLTKLIDIDCEKATILIIRNGIDALLGNGMYKKLYEEQATLVPDKKMWSVRMKKVLNKNARWNLCFAETGHAADFEHGQGTVIAYKDVPMTEAFKNSLPKWLGDKAKNMHIEGNYYVVGKNNCYIGFHGDAERKKVIATRLGENMSLYYQWYFQARPIGKMLECKLNGGDIYIMSEKATGYDWQKRKFPTLRHAAGERALVEFKKAQKKINLKA